MMAERDDIFETCEIVFWRGYVKCAFYAVPQEGEPIGSPFFRSRERSPVQSGKALDAHRTLVERLQNEGWEPVARGRTWYALTFRRRGWSPIEELFPDEPPAEAPPEEPHAARPPSPEPAPGATPAPGPTAAVQGSRRQQAS